MLTYVGLAAQIVIAVVFLISGMSKLHSWSAVQEFARSVRALPLPAQLRTTRTALAIAATELIVPVLLAVPVTTRVGFGVAIALLAVFSYAVVKVLQSGRRVPCRCFGVSDVPMHAADLLRNAVLIAIAAFGVVSQAARPSALTIVGVALVLFVAAYVSVGAVFFDDLSWLVGLPTSPDIGA